MGYVDTSKMAQSAEARWLRGQRSSLNLPGYCYRFVKDDLF